MITVETNVRIARIVVNTVTIPQMSQYVVYHVTRAPAVPCDAVVRQHSDDGVVGRSVAERRLCQHAHVLRRR